MSKIFFRSLFFDPDIDFNIYGGVKLHDKVHSQVLKIQGVHKIVKRNEKKRCWITLTFQTRELVSLHQKNHKWKNLKAQFLINQTPKDKIEKKINHKKNVLKRMMVEIEIKNKLEGIKKL